jgi:hypothetical protein
MQLRFLSLWQLLARFVVLLSILQPSLALAANEKGETWYQVEIIVAQRTDRSTTLETFPFQPAPISWRGGRTLTPFDPETSNRNELENVEFINLPSDLRILNNEARMLENNADYNLLAHKSWRQIIKGNKAINWIDINGGYAWGGHQQLEGSLGFSKGRFLHVHSELHLNQFPSIQSASSQRAKQRLFSAGQSLVPIVETRYSLIQRRKMRSKELHYIDHPKLVLLVKIIPFTPAEPILEEVEVKVAVEDEPTLVDLTAPSIVE